MFKRIAARCSDRRRSLAAALLWLSCTAGQAQGLAAPLAARYLAPEPQLLVVLELRLGNDVLADALYGYQYGPALYLPLGELARSLSLAIKVDAEAGSASGFILSEQRGFHLSLERGQATLSNRQIAVDAAQIRLQADDIYVDSKLLAHWLPVDFAIDMARLSVGVLPREPLPLQQLRDRQRLLPAAATGAPSLPAPTWIANPHRLASVPSIDQTVTLAGARGGGLAVTASTYAAADLLGMQADSYLYAGSGRPAARLTLARHDPAAGLLGPLQARTVQIGSDIALPVLPHRGVARLSERGGGIGFSNQPLGVARSLDRVDLTGNLPSGWDVQLFHNKALIGFQLARTDGRYQFDGLPLAYGVNDFQLVFHGPTGQVRVEQRQFLLDQSHLPAGQLYYQVAARADPGIGATAAMQFDWGIDRQLTLSGGLLSQRAALPAQAAQRYGQLSLNAYLDALIASAGVSRAPDGRLLSELGIKTRVAGVALDAVRVQPNGYTSDLIAPADDPLRLRHQVRAEGNVPGLALVYSIALQSDRRRSGAREDGIVARLSAQLFGLAVANQFSGRSTPADKVLNGIFQFGRLVGGNSLSAQFHYQLRPVRAIAGATLAMHRRLGQGATFNLNVARAVSSKESQFMVGISKNFGSFALGVTASYASAGALTLGVRMFTALGFEPRQARFEAGPMPQLGTSAASLHAFLDKNANGRIDVGEESLPSVGFTVNGARQPARTNAAGIALLSGLPVKQAIDIAIDPLTLDDPYWLPQSGGARYLPRPGTPNRIDLAVLVTGEIDGTVLVQDPASKSGRRGIGGLLLELRDAQGQLVTTATSGPDGYYLLAALPPGRYAIGVSAAQASQLGLQSPPSQSVIISAEGNVVSGADIVLVRLPPPAR